MSVKIRLKQTGKRNRHSFRIVAVDESKKRDGKVIEELGFVDKRVGKEFAPQLKKERIDYWLKLGARMSQTVEKMVQKS